MASRFVPSLPDCTASVWLVGLFLLLALPLGMFLLIATPPGQVADEYSHALRADSLLRGEIVGHRRTFFLDNAPPVTLSGVDANRAFIDISSIAGATTAADPPPFSAEQRRRVAAVAWAPAPVFVHIGPIGAYMPVFYLPQAMAIGVGRLFGAGPEHTFIAARLAGFMVCLGLAIAALLLARRGRALILATLLLPMTISLEASVSQDGLLIATACLAAALLGRSPAPRSPAFVIAALAIGGIAMVKPPYLPLAAFLLLPLPPATRAAWRALWRPRLIAIAAIGVLTLGWIGLTVSHVATPIPHAPYEAGPLWPGERPALFAALDMRAQLRVLFARPRLMVTLPWRQFLYDGNFLCQSLIGKLGWLQVSLQAGLYPLWQAGLLAAVAGDLLGPLRRRVAEIGLALLALVIMIWLIYLSQYLSFTPAGMNSIGGVQGRYFLPLLPFLALALSSWRPGPASRWSLLPLCLPLLIAAIDMVAVPRVIINFFY